jgi:DNA-binding response OmpR family regulator
MQNRKTRNLKSEIRDGILRNLQSAIQKLGGVRMRKILIVDDRTEVRELVEVTLRGKDYEILQAESGEKAIEIARKEKPELIIMDIMMPGGMDGLEACRILKEDSETRSAKIIMLTGKGQEIDRQEGVEVGADDYFTKPFSPLELLKKVEEVLRQT